MPKNMSVLLKGFKHILVPEMNMGQFKTVLRDQFLVDAQPLTKVQRPPVPHRRDRGGDRRPTWGRTNARALQGTTLATSVDEIRMKPMNVVPMILLLVVVLYAHLLR